MPTYRGESSKSELNVFSYKDSENDFYVMSAPLKSNKDA